MSKKEETVKVTFRLPKRLMKILENENYFDWNKDHFFVAATISFISCNLSEIDYDKVIKLYRKYGKNFATLYVETNKNLKVLSP